MRIDSFARAVLKSVVLRKNGMGERDKNEDSPLWFGDGFEN